MIYHSTHSDDYLWYLISRAKTPKNYYFFPVSMGETQKAIQKVFYGIALRYILTSSHMNMSKLQQL